MANTIHDIWLHNPVQFSRSTWKDKSLSSDNLFIYHQNWCPLFFSHPPRLSKLSWSLWGETVKSHCTTKQRYICCALFLCGRQVRKEQNKSSNFNQLEKLLWWWQVSVIYYTFQQNRSWCTWYIFCNFVVLAMGSIEKILHYDTLGAKKCLLTIFIIKS